LDLLLGSIGGTPAAHRSPAPGPARPSMAVRYWQVKFSFLIW